MNVVTNEGLLERTETLSSTAAGTGRKPLPRSLLAVPAERGGHGCGTDTRDWPGSAVWPKDWSLLQANAWC